MATAYLLSYSKMADLPPSQLPLMRELSFGREDGTMWRWTFSKGETYACLIEDECGDLLGWSCITFDEDLLPMVGSYIDPEYRGQGLSTIVVRHMLKMANLPPSTPVYAVAENWPKWKTMLHEAELTYIEWT